jgi:hypothetical protein
MDRARSAARGSIELHSCPECRLVFNRAFDQELLDYSPRYENSLHCSPHFSEFAEELANHLVDRFALHDEVVLEVGCGRAEFLARVCSIGRNHGVGFDQSFDPEGEIPDPGDGTLHVETAAFPASTEGLAPALTFCRHVLEHIPDARAFVEAMVSVAGRRTEGGIYVEVPNALYTLRDLGIWDIIYEHCAYYTGPSLTRLLTTAGVRVTSARAAYGEQFLCVEGAVGVGGLVELEDQGEWEGMISAFADHQRSKVTEWAERLARRRSRGEPLALWGAGSKGVTFLNVVPGSEAIDHVIDLNPRKHDRFTAGTGHRIEPPSVLDRDPPAAVLVMNPLYVSEIRSRLTQMGLSPEIEVV